MRRRAIVGATVLAAIFALSAPAQVIEFESAGLKYKTLTRRGVTIMFAPLPPQVRGYAAIQVAVSNGSQDRVTIPPEQFEYKLADGTVVPASGAESVISSLIQRASRDDVIKLVTAYEAGLYGIVRFRSTNGYEKRRQAALAEVSSTKLKAAAAASAIAYIGEELRAGASTDGVVFFYTNGRSLEGGNLVVRAINEVFDFYVDEDRPTRHLELRSSDPPSR